MPPKLDERAARSASVSGVVASASAIPATYPHGGGHGSRSGDGTNPASSSVRRTRTGASRTSPLRCPAMSDPVDVAPTGLAPVPPSLAVVGAAIEARVRRLLDAEIARWDLVDDGLHVPLVQLRTLVLAGGKRLRP